MVLATEELRDEDEEVVVLGRASEKGESVDSLIGLMAALGATVIDGSSAADIASWSWVSGCQGARRSDSLLCVVRSLFWRMYRVRLRGCSHDRSGSWRTSSWAAGRVWSETLRRCCCFETECVGAQRKKTMRSVQRLKREEKKREKEKRKEEKRQDGMDGKNGDGVELRGPLRAIVMGAERVGRQVVVGGVKPR